MLFLASYGAVALQAGVELEQPTAVASSATSQTSENAFELEAPVSASPQWSRRAWLRRTTQKWGVLALGVLSAVAAVALVVTMCSRRLGQRGNPEPQGRRLSDRKDDNVDDICGVSVTGQCCLRSSTVRPFAHVCLMPDTEVLGILRAVAIINFQLE